MFRDASKSTSSDLGVEHTVQRRLLVLVEDVCACPVLQQHLNDPLVTPACCHVQSGVAFIVLQVQVALVDVVVHQGLHTLRRTNTTGGNVVCVQYG